MSANLYDLLDVAETASTEEIRAAWKAAIADLDPTERRFRAYSDAAGVLLDEDKRAAYDAELASIRDQETAAAEAAADEAGEVAPASATEPDADPRFAPRPEPSPIRAAPSAGPPGWILGAVGVAALLAVVLAVYLFAQPGGRLFGDGSPQAVTERNNAAARTILSAEGAAERLVAPVLSYNHASMEADLDRLGGYLTDKMLAKQTNAWPELTSEAVKQEIVVEAKATGAALTRLSADNKRATVVVFIDQYVEKGEAAPFVLRMWATMELVRKGADQNDWLLDNLCTDASCG